MLLEEFLLLIACMAMSFVASLAVQKFNYVADVYPKKLVFRGLFIVSVMCLYLALVGGFSMLYMAITRYFQIIF